METTNILADIMNTDITVLQRAEAELSTHRASNSGALLQLFISNLKNDKVEVAQMACVLLKKYFLDNTENVNENNFEDIKNAVTASVDTTNQPMLLLKRKGDLISKVFML